MNIFDLLGSLNSAVKDADEAELRTKAAQIVLTAQAEAVRMQKEVMDLREENEKLRKEKAAHDKTDEIEKHLYFRRQAWWRDDETIRLAYCPTCWGTNRQQLPLMREAGDAGFCNACKGRFRRVYDGPKPDRNDKATPDDPPPPPPAPRKPSVREQMRDL